MRRPVLRALMVVVGVATLAVYLAGAYLAYLLARTVWALRPSAPTLALALVVSTLVLAYVSYRVNTARILHGSAVRELPPGRAPGVYRRVRAYSEKLGIDPPRLLVADLGGPNALALGGGLGRGAVLVDRRLFGLLARDELTAILAHELAHIRHRDSLVQTFGYSAVQTLAGLAVLALAPVLVVVEGLARGLAWVRGRPADWERTIPGRIQRGVTGAVAAGLFALTLGLLALSRRRELAADDRAVDVTGDPLALARALRKIERATDPLPGLRSSLYVRGDEDGTLTRLLSTHPGIDERVERLRERASRASGVPVEVELR